MEKHFYKHVPHFLLLGVLFISSCRETFDEEFREVPIINNAPEVTREIGEVVLTQFFGSTEIDLSRYISDAESDPVSYTATSSNTDVVTVSVSGSVLTLTEGETLGTSEISIEGTDGNEGNEFSTSFTAIVSEPGEGPSGLFVIDFNVASGTAGEDITVDGATIEWAGDGASTRTVFSGVLEWSVEEYDAMIISFDPPLDISSNPILSFDYADMWAVDIWMIVGDDAGGDSGELFVPDEGDFTENDSEFNTFTLDLSTYGLDVTAISEIYFEKAEGPGTWRLDNFILGPEE